MGIFAGAVLVFFAFIGFDVVATSAEEVKNPQNTLPRGIFGGLAVVTLLYILVSLALTGMVSYKDLAGAEKPTLTTAFEAVGNTDAAKIIAFGSLVGLTTVGQPRHPGAAQEAPGSEACVPCTVRQGTAGCLCSSVSLPDDQPGR